MNRSQFIRELREALKNNVSEADVQENVRYYAKYIDDEVKKGRSEKEVVAELGDPWLIAKTIATTPGSQSGYQGYEDTEDSYVKPEKEKTNKNGRSHVWQIDSKWKILLLIAAVVLVLVLIFSIISGIISLLMPILGPLLVIIVVIKIFSNKKR